MLKNSTKEFFKGDTTPCGQFLHELLILPLKAMGEEVETEITSTTDLQWLDRLIYSIPVLWVGTKATRCDPWGILAYHLQNLL